MSSAKHFGKELQRKQKKDLKLLAHGAFLERAASAVHLMHRVQATLGEIPHMFGAYWCALSALC